MTSAAYDVLGIGNASPAVIPWDVLEADRTSKVAVERGHDEVGMMGPTNWDTSGRPFRVRLTQTVAADEHECRTDWCETNQVRIKPRHSIISSRQGAG